MTDFFGGSKPKMQVPEQKAASTLESPEVQEAQARAYKEKLTARGKGSTILAGRRGMGLAAVAGTPGGYQPATTLGGDRR